jgi:hypothetical protein
MTPPPLPLEQPQGDHHGDPDVLRRRHEDYITIQCTNFSHGGIVVKKIFDTIHVNIIPEMSYVLLLNFCVFLNFELKTHVNFKKILS